MIVDITAANSCSLLLYSNQLLPIFKQYAPAIPARIMTIVNIGCLVYQKYRYKNWD